MGAPNFVVPTPQDKYPGPAPSRTSVLVPWQDAEIAPPGWVIVGPTSAATDYGFTSFFTVWSDDFIYPSDTGAWTVTNLLDAYVYLKYDTQDYQQVQKFANVVIGPYQQAIIYPQGRCVGVLAQVSGFDFYTGGMYAPGQPQANPTRGLSAGIYFDEGQGTVTRSLGVADLTRTYSSNDLCASFEGGGTGASPVYYPTTPQRNVMTAFSVPILLNNLVGVTFTHISTLAKSVMTIDVTLNWVSGAGSVELSITRMGADGNYYPVCDYLSPGITSGSPTNVGTFTIGSGVVVPPVGWTAETDNASQPGINDTVAIGMQAQYLLSATASVNVKVK